MSIYYSNSEFQKPIVCIVDFKLESSKLLYSSHKSFSVIKSDLLSESVISRIILTLFVSSREYFSCSVDSFNSIAYSKTCDRTCIAQSFYSSVAAIDTGLKNLQNYISDLSEETLIDEAFAPGAA